MREAFLVVADYALAGTGAYLCSHPVYFFVVRERCGSVASVGSAVALFLRHLRQRRRSFGTRCGHARFKRLPLSRLVCHQRCWVFGDGLPTCSNREQLCRRHCGHYVGSSWTVPREELCERSVLASGEPCKLFADSFTKDCSVESWRWWLRFGKQYGRATDD